MLKKRFSNLIKSKDFQEDPLRAVFTRVSNRFNLISNGGYYKTEVDGLHIKGIPGSLIVAILRNNDYSEADTAIFLKRNLKPGMVYLDIGGHIGEFILLAARLVGESGEIHAFEANPLLANLIAENVKLNSFKNIVINNSAVANTSGEISFCLHNKSFLSTLSNKMNDIHKDFDFIEGSIFVDSIKLDDYCRKINKKINLIKIDVEGAEKLVFEGAKTLLSLPKDDAPIILFEYAPSNYNLFDYTGDDLFKFLKSFGYKIFSFNGLTYNPVESSNDINLEQLNKTYENLVLVKDVELLN